MQLLDKFPIEGGQKDPKQRIIPFLPGKPFLSMALWRAGGDWEKPPPARPKEAAFSRC